MNIGFRYLSAILVLIFAQSQQFVEASTKSLLNKHHSSIREHGASSQSHNKVISVSRTSKVHEASVFGAKGKHGTSTEHTTTSVKNRNEADQKRVAENRELRRIRRENTSREKALDSAGNLQKRSGEGFGNTKTSGPDSLVSNMRLNAQLTAEQAAGTRMPTKISGFSDHALEQMAGRDGGIGVRRDAMLDAWANPNKIDYVPSKYGPTFRLTGNDAVIVVNKNGKVVTTWGTSSAGVRK